MADADSAAALKELAEVAAKAIGVSDADKVDALVALGTNLIGSLTKLGDALLAVAGNKQASAEQGHVHATSLNDLDIELGTKTGDAAYARGAAAPGGWKRCGIQSKEDKDKLLSALTLRLRNNGADTLLNIPDLDKSTGRNNANPEVLSNNSKAPSMNLNNHQNMLVAKHRLTAKSIRAYSNWYNGATDCELVEAPDKLEQETLEFNARGNNGNDALVSMYKRQLRIRSSMLHDFIQNLLTETAYNTFLANRELLEYTKKLDGKTFICGTTLLWMLLEILKPNTAVDAQEHETIIETTTCHPGCQDNPFRYCATMRNAYNELRQKHGIDAYNANRYLTQLFRGLRTTRNEVLRTWTQGLWSQFLVDSSSVKAEDVEKGAVEIYHAQVQVGEWQDAKPSSDEAAKLRKELALLTKQHKNLKEQVSQQSGSTAGADAGKAGDLPEWRKKKVGATKFVDGVKYEWCDKHASERYGTSGLYMTCNDGDHHNHEKWQATKDRRKARSTKKRQATSEEKTTSSGGGDADTKVTFQKDKKAKTLTPAWKKKGKAAFVTMGITQYGMSEQMAEQFYSEFEKNGGDESEADF
jgi:hypothetical protein